MYEITTHGGDFLSYVVNDGMYVQLSVIYTAVIGGVPLFSAGVDRTPQRY